MSTHADVAQALLGTWPSQVAAWGEEGISAYIAELEARGLTLEQVLFAIRTFDPAADFPPSAAKLAQQARVDPSKPTFDEAYQLIYGPGGICSSVRLVGTFSGPGEMAGAKLRVREDRCRLVHPLVGSFAMRYGIERLTVLEVNDPEWGEVRRKELRQAWDQHVEATEGRDVAALVSGRRGELGRFDPLAGISAPKRELEETNQGSAS